MKAVFQGIAAQITDQMLDERVDERAGAHRPPDRVKPYPPPRFSETAPRRASRGLVWSSHQPPVLSWLIPLSPGPHELAEHRERGTIPGPLADAVVDGR